MARRPPPPRHQVVGTIATTITAITTAVAAPTTTVGTSRAAPSQSATHSTITVEAGAPIQPLVRMGVVATIIIITTVAVGREVADSNAPSQLVIIALTMATAVTITATTITTITIAEVVTTTLQAFIIPQ